MSDLIEIQSQIDKLQLQANEIKAREFDGTVKDILAKMQAFGIELKDLKLKMVTGPKAKVKIKTKAKASLSSKKVLTPGNQKKSQAVAPKYRGPNGESWSGRGLTPRWLSLLLADGKTKEDFVINPA